MGDHDLSGIDAGSGRGALWRFVWHHLVRVHWSPEQIAVTLQSMHPDDAQARVSHDTICATICAQPRGGLKAVLIKALRQHKHRRPRPGTGRGLAQGRFWGASNRSSVGTLVERKTRFSTLAKLKGNGAAAALEGFTRQMKHLPGVLRISLTYDRGVEMACHPDLARRLKIDIWSCDPPCPLAARLEREHQGSLAPVPAQRR